MPKKNRVQKPDGQKPADQSPAENIKKARRPLFKSAYFILFIITGAAIATPPAIAANILPNGSIGAVTMISSVAILMFVLVVEIWRQTAKKTGPRLQAQMMAARRKHKNYFV
ncbi:MAG: hypothetical protein L3J21_10625 [Devosiaceae bacterium]|nr:hypothetical protein [Devosiaceae bacterium]